MQDNHTTQLTKTCTGCGRELPATTLFFTPDKRGRGGLHARCKECKTRAQKERYRANPEKYRRMGREYYRSNSDAARSRSRAWRNDNRDKVKKAKRRHYLDNAERIKANRRKWYRENARVAIAAARAWKIANPERKKEHDRAWKINNREQYLESVRGWRRNNPGKVKALAHRRRAREFNAPGGHTAADIQSLYAAQDGRCAYCGAEVGDSYHVDHVVPLSRGGGNGVDNLAIACPPCNLSKSSKLLEEWKAP